MHYVLIIFAVLFVIGLIMTIFEKIGMLLKGIYEGIMNFIERHPYIASLVLVAIVMSFAFIPFSLVMLGLAIFLWNRDETIRKENQSRLLNCLYSTCTEMGYVGGKPVEEYAPEFIGLKFDTGTYESLVNQFIRDVNEHMVCNETSEWIQPALKYLRERIMASSYELDSIIRINKTHISPDIVFVNEAMSNICANNKLFQKIKLDPDGVKDELGVNLKPEICYAYKYNGMPDGHCSDYFVQEELSLDSLGIEI